MLWTFTYVMGYLLYWIGATTTYLLFYLEQKGAECCAVLCCAVFAIVRLVVFAFVCVCVCFVVMWLFLCVVTRKAQANKKTPKHTNQTQVEQTRMAVTTHRGGGSMQNK